VSRFSTTAAVSPLFYKYGKKERKKKLRQFFHFADAILWRLQPSGI